MNVFIRRYKDFYQWFATTKEANKDDLDQTDENQSVMYQGSLDELGDYYRQSETVKNWVLVAPTIDTANRCIQFSAKEKKLISKAIPFLLEEDLLTEASDLHYVAEKPAATHVNIVAVDNDKMAAWLAELASVGIKPTHCLPESKLLSHFSNRDAADWQIVYRNNEFIIRTQNDECSAFEAENFALCLELLTDNYSVLPASIQLIADDDSELGYALTLFPEAIRHLVTTHTVHYAHILQNQFSQQAKLWNLLKGRFAQSHQWVSLVTPWRWVIVGLALVMSVHIAMTFSEMMKYKTQNQQLLIALEEQFRQAIPRGQMVDQRKQLENELQKIQNGGGNGHFMQKMKKIGDVFAKHQVQSLNALNYERDTGEIRIDLVVDNYDKLQTILNDLTQIGLVSEIQNSNAQGEKLHARIRITG